MCSQSMRGSGAYTGPPPGMCDPRYTSSIHNWCPVGYDLPPARIDEAEYRRRPSFPLYNSRVRAERHDWGNYNYEPQAEIHAWGSTGLAEADAKRRKKAKLKRWWMEMVGRYQRNRLGGLAVSDLLGSDVSDPWEPAVSDPWEPDASGVNQWYVDDVRHLSPEWTAAFRQQSVDAYHARSGVPPRGDSRFGYTPHGDVYKHF